MKVIYHVDELEKWDLALHNVKNMLNYGKEHGVTFEAEILANSVAVQALTPAGMAGLGLAALFAEVVAGGIVVAACRNALRGNEISEDGLLPDVVVVPAGVIELMEKQYAGYAYIRP